MFTSSTQSFLPKKERFLVVFESLGPERTEKWWTFSTLCRAPGFAITFMENPLVGLLGGMELVSEQTTLQIRLLV